MIDKNRIKEIKEALEYCSNGCSGRDCPYSEHGRCVDDLQKEALNLINELENHVRELQDGIAKSMLGCEFLPECDSKKLKQFAERLKELLEEKEYKSGRTAHMMWTDTAKDCVNKALEEIEHDTRSD